MPMMNKFKADVLFGKYGNTYFVDQRGHNPDIDTGVVEDVWKAGGLHTGRPLITDTTGKEFEIVSDSTDDTAAGTGARTVTIKYLDGRGYEQQTTVTLNGTTPVALGVLGWRANMVSVATAGSGRKNAGNITLRWVSPDQSVIFDYMGAGDSRSHSCLYTVPKGKVASIFDYGISLIDNGNTFASFSLMIGYESGVEVVGCYCSSTKGARSDVELHSPLIPELTDVWVRVNSVSSNNSEIQAWVKLLVGEANG